MEMMDSFPYNHEPKDCWFYGKPSGCRYDKYTCRFQHRIKDNSAMGTLLHLIKQLECNQQTIFKQTQGLMTLIQQVLSNQHKLQSNQSPPYNPYKVKKARSKRSRSRSPGNPEHETKEMDIHPTSLTASAAIFTPQTIPQRIVPMDTKPTTKCEDNCVVHDEPQNTECTVNATEEVVPSPPRILSPQIPKRTTQSTEIEPKNKLSPILQFIRIIHHRSTHSINRIPRHDISHQRSSKTGDIHLRVTRVRQPNAIQRTAIPPITKAQEITEEIERETTPQTTTKTEKKGKEEEAIISE
eukprot:147512_1